MDVSNVSVLVPPGYQGRTVLPQAEVSSDSVSKKESRLQPEVQSSFRQGARSSQLERAQPEEVAWEVARLQARDREVRAHEMAHLAAAGGYATSGMQLTYERGPDGRQYAVGGEVGVDVSPESTPEETIAKMQVIQRAALAPADPSPQDQRVAALAARQMAEAQVELRQSETVEPSDQSQGAKDRQGRTESEVSDGRFEQSAEDRGDQAEIALFQAQQAWQVRLRLQR